MVISNCRDSDAECKHRDALAIQILAQIIILPLINVPAGESVFHFPISFSTQVDKFLIMRGVTKGELWSLLQACICASNINQFVHYVTVQLGYKFNGTDAHFLWTHIKFPCI